MPFKRTFRETEDSFWWSTPYFAVGKQVVRRHVAPNGTSSTGSRVVQGSGATSPADGSGVCVPLYFDPTPGSRLFAAG